ncbi:hypothetical protein FRAHR75_60070 [Frankia sp. Hr75.2]|nr:hypothetical protein FRAHR75_60070 [Frankia sp. Hr75.2]
MAGAVPGGREHTDGTRDDCRTPTHPVPAAILRTAAPRIGDTPTGRLRCFSLAHGTMLADAAIPTRGRAQGSVTPERSATGSTGLAGYFHAGGAPRFIAAASRARCFAA